MTNGIYEALANEAVAEAERLLSLGVRTEDVVMVMTWDVYKEAACRERFLRNDMIETMTSRARFYGYDVCIINEDAETMFKAAVKGMNYYAGMTVGDTIIVDEDVGACRLYALENTTPVCFTDTGLTVRFEIGPPVRSTDRPADYGRITLTEFAVVRDDVLFGKPWAKWIKQKPKIRTPKEAELSAGDTKELDDFLNSFAKKDTLESAT